MAVRPMSERLACKQSSNGCEYQSLACIYDRIMRHVDYAGWSAHIENINRRFGACRDPRILELGCGTGLLGSHLVAKQYRYLGSDLSLSMCQVAKSRGVPIVCVDALNPAFIGEFDVILFLYDGINYLQSLDEYQRMFAKIYAILKPGAVFIFDVTTAVNSQKNFDDFLDYEDYGDFYYIRHSYFRKPDATQHNEFSIFKKIENTNTYERFDEHHIQHVFDIRHIESTLDPALFEVLGVFDGYTMKPCNSNSERVHFVVRKKNKP